SRYRRGFSVRDRGGAPGRAVPAAPPPTLPAHPPKLFGGDEAGLATHGTSPEADRRAYARHRRGVKSRKTRDSWPQLASVPPPPHLPPHDRHYRTQRSPRQPRPPLPPPRPRDPPGPAGWRQHLDQAGRRAAG